MPCRTHCAGGGWGWRPARSCWRLVLAAPAPPRAAAPHAAAAPRGAEALTVVQDMQPRAEWGSANGRLLLHAEDSVAPRDDGSRYDYVVSLSRDDMIDILKALLHNGGRT